jgi:hypothetical protein
MPVPLPDANSGYRIDKHTQHAGNLPWTLELKANFIPERSPCAGQKNLCRMIMADTSTSLLLTL